MSLDPYKTLGVDKKADEAAIKAAYRRLARQYHPDLNPGDAAAEEKFKEISEAYDILSDEEKKREYDSLGRKAFYERGFGGTGYQRPDFSGAGFSFEEIFGEMFGGPRPGRRRGGFHFGASGPGRGEDLSCGLSISLKEAALGAEAALDLNQPQSCPACRGQGLAAAGGGDGYLVPRSGKTRGRCGFRIGDCTPHGVDLRQEIPCRGLGGNVFHHPGIVHHNKCGAGSSRQARVVEGGVHGALAVQHAVGRRAAAIGPHRQRGNRVRLQ